MNRRPILQTLPLAAAALFSLAMLPVLPARGQEGVGTDASRPASPAYLAYASGRAAEGKADLDAAFSAYAEAARLSPDDAEYRLRLEKVRFALTQSLIERADRARVSGRLGEAAAALRLALQYDPENEAARSQLRQLERQGISQSTALPEYAAAPAHIQPQSGQRQISYRGDARGAWSELARQFGLRAVFDEDATSRQIRFRLANVDFETAARLLGDQTGTFWRAVDRRTLLVFNDTAEKRRQYLPQIERTLVLAESERPEQMNEYARVLRDLAGINHVHVDTRARSLTVRGPEREVALAAALVEQLEQPRGEVMLELDILELDRNRADSLGITPPSSAQVFSLSQQQIQLAQQSTEGLVQVIEQIFGTPSAFPGSTTGQIATLLGTGSAALSSIVPPLIAFGGGKTIFLATLPGATANFGTQVSAVRSARRVLLRAQDGEAATFFVGDRYPINLSTLSNSFQVSGSVPSITIFLFATGLVPQAVIAANLRSSTTNLDLVTANHDSGTVSVLLGVGNGTFETHVDYAVGTNPVALTALASCATSSPAALCTSRPAGTQDLAVANQGSNSVSILHGNGDGTFQAALNFPAGTQPSGIVAADCNGDGITDLAVTNQGSDSVSILLGNGDGTFQAPTNIPLATGKGPIGIAAADFNADGHTDLAVANSVSNTVAVLLGDGAGNFPSQFDLTAGTQPVAIATADFDGDTFPDIVVVNQTDNTASVLLNTGGAAFPTRTDFTVGSQPSAVITGDFNNDGNQDFIVANRGDNSGTIFFGVGTGQFPSVVSVSAGVGPSGLAGGDFNGDGLRDIAVSNSGSNTVNVVINSQEIQNVNPQQPYPGFQYEDLGLKVKATPRIHSAGDVTLGLTLELRGLSATAFNGIPVINNRSVEQTVRLRENEPTVLSGIFEDQQMNIITGWPGTAELPVVGPLTSRRDIQNQGTELVVVITPRVVRRAPRPERLLYVGRDRQAGLGAGVPGEPGFPRPGVTPVPEPPAPETPPPPSEPPRTEPPQP
jgi:type II secretory pathway component GspD/PulD (secretin)